MLISKQWLSEFVKLPKGVSDADLAKTVTLSTVEVEKVIDQAAAMEGIRTRTGSRCARWTWVAA